MTDDSTCSVLKEASYGNSQLGASQIKEYILEFSQKFEIESLVIEWIPHLYIAFIQLCF